MKVSMASEGFIEVPNEGFIQGFTGEGFIEGSIEGVNEGFVGQ